MRKVRVSSAGISVSAFPTPPPLLRGDGGGLKIRSLLAELLTRGQSVKRPLVFRSIGPCAGSIRPQRGRAIMRWLS